MIINKIPKHKVFLSFHHQDEYYKKQLENSFSQQVDVFVSRSVNEGDIDPNLKTDTIRREIRDRFISDTSVTVVLIGNETWQRKHVDWEIGYSLTNTRQNTKSGLIGLLLPSYQPCRYCPLKNLTSDGKKYYTPCNIPPRLHDNINNGYAKIYTFPTDGIELKEQIDQAFHRRSSSAQINSRDYYINNRSGIHW